MGLLTALGISALVYTGVIALAVQSAIYYRPVPDYTGTGGEAGMTKMREMAVDRVPLALQVAQAPSQKGAAGSAFHQFFKVGNVHWLIK